MLRARIASVAAICALAGVFSVAVASATPRGVLSKAEYQQLITAEKRVKTLSPKDPQGYVKADGICRQIRDVSPLVGAVHTDCLALVAFGKAGSNAEDAATKCALDPPSERAVLRCLLPSFRTYYATAKVFYRAETHVATLASARGFKPRCVTVIGDSPKTLAAEARLVDDLKQTVNALKAGNVNELQAVSTRIDHDGNAVSPATGSLSLCPHQ
jgi:hypothetical protein